MHVTDEDVEKILNDIEEKDDIIGKNKAFLIEYDRNQRLNDLSASR